MVGRNGISMLGPMFSPQLTANIRFNNFNYHYYGLHYSMFALTSNQIRTGNIWWQNPISAQGLQALHDNINLNVFTYFNTDNNIIPPPVPPATFHPSHSPSTWFKPEPGSNLACDDSQTNYHYCNLFQPSMTSSLSDMDRKIAQGTIENDPYTAETQWMMEKGLYSKLDNNLSLLSDTLMNDFYQSKQGSALAELVAIGNSSETLFASDSTSDTLVAQSHTVIEQQLDDIHAQMDLLDTAVVHGDTTSISGITSTIIAAQETVTDAAQQADSSVNGLDSLRHIAATGIRAGNNGINTVNAPEDNEKQVNEIYLNTIARGIYSFDDEQVLTLTRIAWQCPVAGGLAVFRARSLLALTEAALHYDDRQICADAGIGIRTGNTTEPFKPAIAYIQPNPAMNEASLIYSLLENTTAAFSIYTTTGQNLLFKKVTAEQRNYTFSIMALYPGVYHYELISNGSIIAYGKLVIIR
ncbi:MAG: T9SS type A sorting domain-containing protein [Bacteroidota bacterium]